MAIVLDQVVATSNTPLPEPLEARLYSDESTLFIDHY